MYTLVHWHTEFTCESRQVMSAGYSGRYPAFTIRYPEYYQTEGRGSLHCTKSNYFKIQVHLSVKAEKPSSTNTETLAEDKPLL